jgi:uncharacterized protein (TIGR00255 family)
MIRSMTGFARAERATPLGQLVWELRTVNHRYLEVQLKLPEAFRSLEQEARQRVGAAVRRGKTDAVLTFRTAASAGTSARLNMARVSELIAHADRIAGALHHHAPLNPLDLLRWGGVLEEEEAPLETLQPACLEVLAEGLESLGAARAREGARIRDMLEERCRDITTIVGRLRERLPQVHAAVIAKQTERLRTLATGADAGRLEQELALIAQKLDVSEELDRLLAHCAEFRDTMHKPEPAGRRLDFLLQEFNREANTLASKSADAETSRNAVDLKVLIEQMREQVQNVE